MAAGAATRMRTNAAVAERRRMRGDSVMGCGSIAPDRPGAGRRDDRPGPGRADGGITMRHGRAGLADQAFASIIP